MHIALAGRRHRPTATHFGFRGAINSAYDRGQHAGGVVASALTSLIVDWMPPGRNVKAYIPVRQNLAGMCWLSSLTREEEASSSPHCAGADDYVVPPQNR
jgi:hypothetical protein